MSKTEGMCFLLKARPPGELRAAVRGILVTKLNFCVNLPENMPSPSRQAVPPLPKGEALFALNNNKIPINVLSSWHWACSRREQTKKLNYNLVYNSSFYKQTEQKSFLIFSAGASPRPTTNLKLPR